MKLRSVRDSVLEHTRRITLPLVPLVAACLACEEPRLAGPEEATPKVLLTTMVPMHIGVRTAALQALQSGSARAAASLASERFMRASPPKWRERDVIAKERLDSLMSAGAYPPSDSASQRQDVGEQDNSAPRWMADVAVYGPSISCAFESIGSKSKTSLQLDDLSDAASSKRLSHNYLRSLPFMVRSQASKVWDTKSASMLTQFGGPQTIRFGTGPFERALSAFNACSLQDQHELPIILNPGGQLATFVRPFNHPRIRSLVER